MPERQAGGSITAQTGSLNVYLTIIYGYLLVMNAKSLLYSQLRQAEVSLKAALQLHSHTHLQLVAHALSLSLATAAPRLR